MKPVERFLEYLQTLCAEVNLYHGGLVERHVVRERMMPTAEKLVTVLFNEMDALAVQTACSLHPDAARVIGYAYGK